MLKVYNTFEIVDWTLTDLRSVARLFSNNTGYHQRNGESVPSAADSHNGTGLAATRCVIAGYTKQCPDLLLFALGSSDRRKCEERYGTGKYNNLRSGQCRSSLVPHSRFFSVQVCKLWECVGVRFQLRKR